MSECWFCEESIDENEAVSCSSCLAAFHRQCWLKSSGCPRAECFSIKAHLGLAKELKAPESIEAKRAAKTFNLTVPYLHILQRLFTFEDESGWVSCQYQWSSSGAPLWTNEHWLPDHAIKYILQRGGSIRVFGRDDRELFHAITDGDDDAEAIALFAECTILSSDF